MVFKSQGSLNEKRAALTPGCPISKQSHLGTRRKVHRVHVTYRINPDGFQEPGLLKTKKGNPNPRVSHFQTKPLRDKVQGTQGSM